jgi:hypothetical protein
LITDQKVVGSSPAGCTIRLEISPAVSGDVVAVSV